jgi:hypothetical protein
MSTVGQEMDWSRELAGCSDVEVAGRWLDRVAGRVRDGFSYWRLMREVWVRAESGEGWDPALRRFPEHRAASMTEDERAALAAMPEVIEVWHGVTTPECEFAWTLDRDVAVWFTRRFVGHRMEAACRYGIAVGEHEPRVLHGTVRRDDVIFFLDLGEREVVVFPDTVTVLDEEAV